MSKLAASEFQTWDSLYWPEATPRTLSVTEDALKLSWPQISEAWHFDSPSYSVNKESFAAMIELVTESIRDQKIGDCVAVQNSDPLSILTSALIPLKTGISSIVVPDSLVENAPCPWILRKVGSTNDPKEDYRMEQLKGQRRVANYNQPSISILLPGDVRATYALYGLMKAAASLDAFVGLARARGVAILGSLQEEFTFFIATTALLTGVPLILLDKISSLQKYPRAEVSALFIGRDPLSSIDDKFVDEFQRQLRPRNRLISFVATEGPVTSVKSQRLERVSGVPVLQMYGVSGRGIVFANPIDFNVHGSVGIPITNVEAVIADNWEGNWTRDRILIGPGVDGELAVRGAFIESVLDVGDSRQNTVKVRILDKSTEWIATSVTGRMDENGYFYLNDFSFR